MSLDGKMYCYRNPLAFYPSTGDMIRNPWYDTTCCPPNPERTFASLPCYFYSSSPQGLYVHFYDNSKLHWRLENGTKIAIQQTRQYPWEGTVHLPVTFTFFVRTPGWSQHNSVRVNGHPIDGVKPGSIPGDPAHLVDGRWVELSFDMQPQALHANLAVADDRWRVAFQRGPIVYCMEQLDQAVAATDTEAFARYVAQPSESTAAHYQAELLEGVVVLEHPAVMLPGEPASLYQPTLAQGEPG